MDWNGKPFYGLNEHLREKFGEKVIKLSLDGGFSCPNRDGTLSRDGCIFCDEVGSGAFAGGRNFSLREQIEAQKDLLSPKWEGKRFVAYFQNFSNTYAPVETLRRKYEEALACEGVVGLAIATRPDCLDKAVLDLLEELSARTFLWVELGLQTAHDTTAALLNRGYPFSLFEEKMADLCARRIAVVAHLILSLPGETRTDMLESARRCAVLGVSGLKLHMLHVVQGTALEKMYRAGSVELMEQHEYISLVADILEGLPPWVVIHRITGDGDGKSLVAPLWTLGKKRVYTGVIMELARRKSYQGKDWKPS